MVQIRKLRWDDFEDFCDNERSYSKELENDSNFGIGTYRKKLKEVDLVDSFSMMYKNTLSKNSIVLIAVVDGHMVGICHLDSNVFIEAPHVANLGYSVIKKYRRKGIATALIKEILKQARDKYEIIVAGFFANNKASRKLLQRFGFKRWAFGPKFVKRGKIYLDNEMMYLNIKK